MKKQFVSVALLFYSFGATASEGLQSIPDADQQSHNVVAYYVLKNASVTTASDLLPASTADERHPEDNSTYLRCFLEKNSTYSAAAIAELVAAELEGQKIWKLEGDTLEDVRALNVAVHVPGASDEIENMSEEKSY